MTYLGLVGIAIVAVATFAWTGVRLRSVEKGSTEPLTLGNITRSRFSSKAATTALVVYRAFLAVYIFIVLILDVNKNFHEAYFYTVWNWALLFIYFAFVTFALVVRRCSSGAELDAEGVAVDLRAAVDMQGRNVAQSLVTKPWQSRYARICQVLCSMVSCNVFVVDVILWTVLFPASPPYVRQRLLQSPYNWNMHLANLFFVMLEVWLNDIPECDGDIVYVVAFGLFYGLFNMLRIFAVPATRHCIIETCKNVGPGDSQLIDGYMVWPYFFLDSSRWYSGIYYFGLCFALYCFYRLSVCLRRKVVPRDFRLQPARGISFPLVAPA